MKKKIDLVISKAAQVLTMDEGAANCAGEDTEAGELGIIENGAVAVDKGLVLDVGTAAQLDQQYEPAEEIDAAGCILTPGLVDPHTHVVFAGSRHVEFGMRMRGATYHEILAKGGGIHSTVRATREASLEELVALALPRLKSFLGFGVTTVEAKSGYGLDKDTEIKILSAVNLLDKSQPIRMIPTYLGAHVVPIEYREKRDEYVNLVVREVIPEVAERGLAAACDVFLDEGAYTLDEASTILKAAVDAGMKAKIHAGQFTDQGGPEMISQMGALSADHLELVSDKGVEAMARSGMVANLLPGAAFSLRDHFPDGRRLIDGGVTVAVATDDNPGTSRTENLPLMAAMAVTRMGLTAAEAWKAITVNAAKALGMEDEIGSLKPGLVADLAVFQVSDFRAFLYHFGMNHMKTVVVGGQVVV